ncbi:WxL protein peptidoglycan domain-containing protein [Cellulomonas sp. HZM]|uniref:WxL protein peptidoglycan domain-containing protein n=1 Tax=Cellulomonas sp. HZM TaxID=1454010 RepID=UPI0006906E1F|nr:DUF916 domain-containing protein [Cellulomonas sp. HZM]
MRPLAALVVGLAAALVGTPAAAAVPVMAPAADDGTVQWAVAPADGDLGTGRPNFGYSVEPGQTVHDAIVVTNKTPTALTLAVYAADAFTTSSGQLDLLPAGEPSKDVGAWVHLDDDEITLKAGASTTVPFTLEVPKDATPGDHSGGVVTSFRSAQDGSPVALDSRLGSRMHVRVAGELSPAVAATDLRVEYHQSWNPFAPGSVTLRYELRNTGNTRVAAAQTAQVQGPGGVLRTAADRAETPELIAGSVLEQSVEISGVWPAVRIDGRADVFPEGVGVGGATLPTVVVEGSTWAVPWTLLALVVLVVAGAVVVGWRRGRRGATPGTGRDAPDPEAPDAPEARDARDAPEARDAPDVPNGDARADA